MWQRHLIMSAHEGRIYKIIRIKIFARLIHLLYYYVCSRTFRVRINSILLNYKSYFRETSLAFSCLINFNNIPRSLYTHLVLYADDRSIYSTAHYPYTLYRNKQAYIDTFMNWCNLSRVKINENNTC